MTYRLVGKEESVGEIATLFRDSDGTEVEISVHEDKCFNGEACLSLGRLVLRPGQTEPGADDALRLAVEHGFYEWHLPEEEKIIAEAYALLSMDDGRSTEDQRSKARQALNAITNVACRVGLIHPILDAGSVANLPFKEPATVVVDTSAIVQGGLDFVIRFLYPMARIKVPAIAHMELLNLADNYFNMRRKNHKSRGRMLFEHVLSQGGQRSLLRSELQTGTEIERGRLGADPLRGVVGTDSDPEDKSLGLHVVQRSFADRLMFETARQHAAQSSQDHRVLLMTCDQGLARMTIAEGMQPLFFEQGKLGRLSTVVLTGTAFHPFNGRVYEIPLASLVWELAITFGMCRLSSPSGRAWLDVCAIGQDLPWKPYYTKDDLLWLRRVDSPAEALVPRVRATKAGGSKTTRSTNPLRLPERLLREKRTPSGAYKFSPSKMLILIEALTAKNELTYQEALAVLELESQSQLADYRNFLASGGFVEADDVLLIKNKELDLVWSAIKMMDRKAFGLHLTRIPSFKAFMDDVSSGRSRPPANGTYGIPKRALQNYLALAEAATLALGIPDDGIFPTPANPAPAEFSDIALAIYSVISMGSNDYILTGGWLEALAREHGIHPIDARDRLAEASAAGYLQRFTEGSTPETSYARHSVSVLQTIRGRPSIQKASLFEGDFLLPGTSSVSLKLVRGRQ